MEKEIAERQGDLTKDTHSWPVAERGMENETSDSQASILDPRAWLSSIKVKYHLQPRGM